MVLPGVDLPDHPADRGPGAADDDEYVLGDEPLGREAVYDVHVGEALGVGADLVLALDDVDPALPEHPPGLPGCFYVELEHGLVVFCPGLLPSFPVFPAARVVAVMPFAAVAPVVAVMPLEALVARVGGAAPRVHVGRVEDDAVHLRVPVGQVPAVGAGGGVGGPEVECVLRHPFPEHAPAECDVGHGAARGDVEG